MLSSDEKKLFILEFFIIYNKSLLLKGLKQRNLLKLLISVHPVADQTYPVQYIHWHHHHTY